MMRAAAGRVIAVWDFKVAAHPGWRACGGEGHTGCDRHMVLAHADVAVAVRIWCHWHRGEGPRWGPSCGRV